MNKNLFVLSLLLFVSCNSFAMKRAGDPLVKPVVKVRKITNDLESHLSTLLKARGFEKDIGIALRHVKEINDEERSHFVKLVSFFVTNFHCKNLSAVLNALRLVPFCPLQKYCESKMEISIEC